MGVDKRFIKVGERSLFSRALDVLDRCFGTVVVSIADASVSLPAGRHRVLVDAIPGCATLGGLYTALKVMDAEWIFAAACDMPLLSPKVIEYLVDQRNEHDFVMPLLSTGPQPMCACYRRTCLPAVEGRIQRKDLRLHGLLEEPSLRGRLIPEAELVRLDPHLVSFLNVNTPADLELVRKLLGSQFGQGSMPK